MPRADVEELNLEEALANGPSQADQLVEPLSGQRAVALAVNVESVRFRRNSPVESNAERNRRAERDRSHDEVDVTRMEAEQPLSARPRRDRSTVPPRTRAGRQCSALRLTRTSEHGSGS